MEIIALHFICPQCYFVAEIIAQFVGTWPDWWVPEPADECLDRLRLGRTGTSMADCLRIRLGTDKRKLWLWKFGQYNAHFWLIRHAKQAGATTDT